MSNIQHKLKCSERHVYYTQVTAVTASPVCTDHTR